MASRPARLAQLDGLRGIAAVAVMLYHVHNLFGFTLGCERAYLFVDLFFMLSGFVLARSIDGRPDRAPGAGAFIAMRIRRLWPMMIIGCAIGAAVHAMLGDVPHLPLLGLAGVAMVPAFWENRALFPLNGPQWSIFWELAANIAHVALWRRLSDTALLVMAVAMASLLLAAIMHHGSDQLGAAPLTWSGGGLRAGWGYTIGMWLSRSRSIDRPPVVPWLPALLVPLVIVLLLPMARMPDGMGDALCTFLLMPGSLYLIATSRRPRAAEAILGGLGALSFPLYAIHLPILCLFARLDGTARGAVGAVALSILGALLLSGRAWLTPPAPARPAQGTPTTVPASIG